MREIMIDLILHIAGLLIYTIVAVMLAIAGVFIEYRGYLFFSDGETQLAAWVGAIGLIALITAALIIRDKVVKSVFSIHSLIS